MLNESDWSSLLLYTQNVSVLLDLAIFVNFVGNTRNVCK
jgi:hypothetical protein